MIVNFIDHGFLLTTAELDYPPDNDDRVVFNNDIYIVEDRIFRIGKNHV